MKTLLQVKHAIFFLLQYLISTSLIAQTSNDKRPNILFILLDDARYDMFAPNGGPAFFSTPAIDRIANEGINFKYTGLTTSLCTPSRSSFYTGLYSHHHGAVDNMTSPKQGLNYISSLLQRAGYYTGFVGKWNNLPDTPIGFNYWATTKGGHLNPKVTFNDGSVVTYIGHDAVIYTDLGIDFLTNKVPAEKPWVLFIFHRVPHTPYEPLPEEDSLYQHSSINFPDNFVSYQKYFPSYLYPKHQYTGDSTSLDQDLRNYYETCHAAEYNVDSMLSYLEANHILDSTMVIFSSDNGYMFGEHDLVHKTLSYRESLRAPLFIRYPLWFAPGTIMDSDWAANIDIAPTLLEAAGIPDTFKMDGISLHQLAEGNVHRKDFFYEYYDNTSINWEAVSSLSYEYIYSYCTGITEEFYDLTTDPKENNNLIFDSSYASLIQEFRMKRDSLRLATDDTIFPDLSNCSMQSFFYADGDADGFGNTAISIKSTAAPSGYVLNNDDCNDANSNINPGEAEICNGIDDNCNGQIDEGSKSTFYLDADADGYGNENGSVLACNVPNHYVSDNTDCNDANNTVYPGATEICNDIDDNCNSEVDEGVKLTFYADGDGDGYGSSNLFTFACTPPNGYVYDSSDCNDADASINPNTTEVLNGIDDDCDGLIDESATFYADEDHDGFGNVHVMIDADAPPDGYAADHTDCDDANDAIHPGASEVCNNIDDNCNGQIDEGVKLTFYADVDGDTYGNSNITTQSCLAPTGFVSNSTDCNDLNTNIHPNATEICNNQDDNCDGQIDEGVQSAFYADDDGDGYGKSTVSTQGCTAPEGYVSNSTDCNDANASIHPGAADICNGLDDNCNGAIDENAISATVSPSGTVPTCTGVFITLTANGGSGISYQWQKNNKNISGATTQNYSTKAAADYHVKETNSFNCASTSATTTINVFTKPSATITPLGNLNICQTGSVVLQANSGTGYTYQWKKGTSNISGATNQTYTATKAANYKVVVTNGGICSKTSAGTKVTKSCKESLIENDNSSSSLIIYPNPTNGKFMIELKLNDVENGISKIQVINILGETIYSEDAPVVNGELVKEISFDHSIARSIYFVSVRVNDKVYSAQIIYQE